jgi:hypothetical protein
MTCQKFFIKAYAHQFCDKRKRKHVSAYCISELESNVIKLKNQLNKLQIKKSEYEDRDLQVKEECARLKETIVSITLFLLQYQI